MRTLYSLIFYFHKLGEEIGTEWKRLRHRYPVSYRMELFLSKLLFFEALFARPCRRDVDVRWTLRPVSAEASLPPKCSKLSSTKPGEWYSSAVWLVQKYKMQNFCDNVSLPKPYSVPFSYPAMSFLSYSNWLIHGWQGVCGTPTLRISPCMYFFLLYF